MKLIIVRRDTLIVFYKSFVAKISLIFAFKIYYLWNVKYIIYLTNYITLSGLCTANVPLEMKYVSRARCTQKYTSSNADNADYGPRWTTWPPLDGSDPLVNVTDRATLLTYDAFKHKSIGL